VPVLPAVTAAAVKSTVEGEHTAAGLVITKLGLGLIVTLTRGAVYPAHDPDGKTV